MESHGLLSTARRRRRPSSSFVAVVLQGELRVVAVRLDGRLRRRRIGTEPGERRRDRCSIDTFRVRPGCACS